MAIIIGHYSAREYYRLAAANLLRMPTFYEGDPRPNAVGGPKRAGGSIVSDKGLTIGELETHGIYPAPDWLHVRHEISGGEEQSILARLTQPGLTGYQLAKPIDLLVSNQGKRGNCRLVQTHVCATSLPPGSFRQISSGLFIASPELLFLQMARCEKSIHVLAAFGCEITSAYSLLPRGLVSMRRQLVGHNPIDASWITIQDLLDADGYVDCSPRTSRDRLEQFLKAVPPHTKGVKRALKALRWVKDGSRSPMETVSSLHLRMPRLLGGFGLGDGEFNVIHHIKPEWQTILQKDHLVIDELFVGQNGKVADVEYNGGKDHSTKAQVMADNQRRRALEDDGMRVFVITARDFLDYRSWEILGEDLTSYLGKHFGPLTDTMRERRLRVHADFADPNFLK